MDTGLTVEKLRRARAVLDAANVRAMTEDEARTSLAHNWVLFGDIIMDAAGVSPEMTQALRAVFAWEPAPFPSSPWQSWGWDVVDGATLRRHRRVHMAHRRRVTILRRAARRQVRREHRALAQRGR